MAMRGTTDVDYFDYTLYQQNLLSGASGEDLWGFWQRQLAGANPILNLPLDRPRPAVQTYVGATHSFTLPKLLRGRIGRFLKGEAGVSLFSFFMSVFHILLYRISGQEDICVGTPAACRNLEEIERVIGNFVNPIVVRSNIGPKAVFRSFLRSLHETVIAALDHQEYPFALVVEKLAKHRDTSRSAIFQVSYMGFGCKYEMK